VSLTPTVWIDGAAWPATIAADTPALAGITLTAGHTDDQTMSRTERLTVQLLQRTDARPDLERGMILAVTVAGPPYRCVFVGRISDATAVLTDAHPIPGGPAIPAVLYTLTAVDVFDELAAPTYSTAAAYLPTEPGWDREQRLASALVAGTSWSFQGNVSSDALPIAAELPQVAQPWKVLELLDDTLRGHRRRRDPVVRRTAAGEISRLLVMRDDPVRTAPPDALLTQPDGTWTVAGTSTAGITTVQLPSSAIPVRALTWVKRREGYLTDLDVITWTSPDHTKREEVTRPASTVLPLNGAQARSGRSTAKVVTGTNNATFTAAQLAALASSWIPESALTGASTEWHVERLTVLADQVDENTIGNLLDVISRASTIVAVSGPVTNHPAGAGHPRGAVIGITATHKHGTWSLELTLSRTPNTPAGGNWWTPLRVGGSPNPAIASATCATVGDGLTFADFKWIGAP